MLAHKRQEVQQFAVFRRAAFASLRKFHCDAVTKGYQDYNWIVPLGVWGERYLIMQGRRRMQMIVTERAQSKIIPLLLQLLQGHVGITVVAFRVRQLGRGRRDVVDGQTFLAPALVDHVNQPAVPAHLTVHPANDSQHT